MVKECLPAGSPVLDKFLSGGYPKQITTVIYGEAGSGKTTLCLLALISATTSGKKVLFIDSGNNFSIERIKQLTKHVDKVLQNTMFFRPKSFEDDHRMMCSLEKFNNANIGLIIFDSIVVNYKLELPETPDKKKVNGLFNENLKCLSDFYKKNDIPVIVTSTIYSTVEGKEENVMSGGNILKNRAKCHIELIKLNQENRAAVLKKHPILPVDLMVEFKIKENGLEKID